MAKPCILAPEAAARLLRGRVQALRKPVDAVQAEDADGIHDMRVASRRLRAVLGEHRAVFAAQPFKSLRKKIRNITRSLGVARELDVTLDILEKRRTEFHGLARHALVYAVRRLRMTRREQSEAVAQSAAWVGSPELDRALMDLFEGLGAQSACYIREAARNLKQQYQAVYRLYGLWKGVPSEEVLHRIRICLKKFRYTCESYGPLYGARMKDFLQELKAAQEALGTWNDYRILRNHLRALEPEAPPRAKEGFPALLPAIETDVAKYLDAFAEGAKTFFSHERAGEILDFLGRPEMACCRSTRPDPQALDEAY